MLSSSSIIHHVIHHTSYCNSTTLSSSSIIQHVIHHTSYCNTYYVKFLLITRRALLNPDGFSWSGGEGERRWGIHTHTPQRGGSRTVTPMTPKGTFSIPLSWEAWLFCGRRSKTRVSPSSTCELEILYNYVFRSWVRTQPWSCRGMRWRQVCAWEKRVGRLTLEALSISLWTCTSTTSSGTSAYSMLLFPSFPPVACAVSSFLFTR